MKAIYLRVAAGLLFLSVSCTHRPIDLTTYPNGKFIQELSMEKCDVDKIRKECVKGKTILEKRNDWLIYINKNIWGGVTYMEYPLSPDFYYIRKRFHSTGYVESYGKILPNNILYDTWYYFDECGNFIREINQSNQYSKVKPDDLLRFLDREGYIDLKTGQGRAVYSMTEHGSLSQSENSAFSLYYNKKGESRVLKGNSFPLWQIVVSAKEKNGWFEFFYLINADTGEVLRRRKTYSPPQRANEYYDKVERNEIEFEEDRSNHSVRWNVFDR